MRERLEVLEANIAELQEFRRKNPLAEVKNSKILEWALRYGLLESIQAVIDVSCHIVAEYNVGSPETYSECIELIAANGYIEDSLSKKLCGMVGLRNLLIHEYMHIDIQQLYGLLDNISDFKSFLQSVSKFI